MNISELMEYIRSGALDDKLTELYGAEDVASQKERYLRACDGFTEFFPGSTDDVYLYSAPGRTEICGNHTDHQHGCVFAAAVDLDVIGIVSFNSDNVIRIKSEGHDKDEIDLSELSPLRDEEGTSAALIRGVAAGFEKRGLAYGGFDAYTTSNVLSGSGLSSSAAFEVLVGTVIDLHYNDGKAGAVKKEKMGQFAENEYFGKKSGLMDQTVCSVGGAVFMDFEDTAAPKVTGAACDLDKYGYTLFITDTKGSHADLSDDYSAVPSEMFSVAKQLGKEFLRACDEEEFFAKLPELRKTCTDRALLRAGHFFAENKRAGIAARALENGAIAHFLDIVKKSGLSSAMWLQNLYSPKSPDAQGITLALAVSEKVLHGAGAYRVHGGGFAGTIQAFVPNELADTYRTTLDSVFGCGSCHKLRIRNAGGIAVL